jgi:hypothetical protein
LALNHPVKQELDKLATTYLVNQELADPVNKPAYRPALQLEHIQASIQGLINREDLEPLQHFKYHLWNHPTPYMSRIR